MQIHSLEPMLAEHPFFKGFNDKHVALLTGCAANVAFDAGEFVFREGKEANHFYVIRHGRVALEAAAPAQKPLILQTRQAGDILGWSWLIHPYHWMFDARATEHTRAVALDGKCLRRKCEEDHELGYEMLKRFAYIMEQELDATRLQLLDVYGAPSPHG
ncbi:MAG TPA: cyclic nucleotide-binding domain-containing protein [Planctomycetota bacterium]|nr:cyclic nucleotide-binding domain-containing protein [Planctomycetota bacterium]